MRRIVLFAVIALVCSCAGDPVPEQYASYERIKRIPVVSMPDSIITKVSEIASDIEYIPLKPSANTQIKAIDEIVLRGNKIYINLINDILCYDNQGYFLYRLYDNGENGNPYNYAVYDFDIDTGDTSLIVLAGNKILCFKNTGTGFDYMKTINLGKVSTSKLDFVPGTNKFLLSFIRRNGYEPSLSMLISIDGEILASKPNYFKRFNPVKSRIWDEIVHYQFDNKLHFRERFNDTVFSIDAESNTFLPVLILDSCISSTNSENINDPGYFRILPNVDHILEVPRYLYYSYKFSQFDYKIFYDKYEDRKHEIGLENRVLKDDICGGPDFDLKYCSEGKFLSWISIKALKKYVEGEDFANAKVIYPKKKEELKELADSLEETDNPVLIILTPKE